MNRLAFILSFVLALAVASCGRTDPALARADAVMEQAPDSALAILEAVDTAALRSERSRALYGLLLTQARVKCDVPVASDSLIAASARYFADHGSDSLAMRALFYKGVVLRDLNRFSEAINPLSESYESAISQGSNYWCAKAAEAMSHVYSANYLKNEAVEKSREAAIYYQLCGKYLNHLYCLTDLGIDYSNAGNTQRGAELLDSTYQIASELNDSAIMAYTSSAMFSTAIAAKDFEKAARSLRLLNRLSSFYNFQTQDIAWIAELGIVENDTTKINAFLEYVKHNQIDQSDQPVVYNILSTISESKGDYKTALEFTDSVLYAQSKYIDTMLMQSVLSSQLNRTEQNLYRTKTESSKRQTLAIFIVLSLTFVSAIIILVYQLRLRAKKHELDKKVIEILRLTNNIKDSLAVHQILEDKIAAQNQDISILKDTIRYQKYNLDEYRQSSETVKELRAELETLFRNSWNLLNKLCNEYFEKEDSRISREIIVKNIESELSKIQKQNNIHNIKESVNKYMSGLVTKLEDQCPTLSQIEINIATLIFAGFNAKSICLFLGIRLKNFYAKRKQLIDTIKESTTPDTNIFLEKLQ